MISENLHRAELTKLQHDEQVAEWIKLTDEEEVLSGVRTKPQGGRPESGVNAAAREIGVKKTAAHEAIKVASLSEEAKAAAIEHHLDDNATALLEAAGESEDGPEESRIRQRRRRTETKTQPTEIQIDANAPHRNVVSAAAPNRRRRLG